MEKSYLIFSILFFLLSFLFYSLEINLLVFIFYMSGWMSLGYFFERLSKLLWWLFAIIGGLTWIYFVKDIVY